MEWAVESDNKTNLYFASPAASKDVLVLDVGVSQRLDPSGPQICEHLQGCV